MQEESDRSGPSSGPSGGCWEGSGAARGPGRAGLGWVLTGQRPVLVVQGLGQVLNSEIMLVT